MGHPAVGSSLREHWGQRAELDVFQRLGKDFAPDIVVTLFLSFNDVENSSPALSNRARQHRLKRGSARPGRMRVAASTPHGVWGTEEGLRRLMIEYPGMKELEWDLDQPDKRVERLCQENDIPFLALEPLFRVETERGRRPHFPVNGHWNPEGNDLAGRLMAEFLLGLEEPPEPASP